MNSKSISNLYNNHGLIYLVEQNVYKLFNYDNKYKATREKEVTKDNNESIVSEVK